VADRTLGAVMRHSIHLLDNRLKVIAARIRTPLLAAIFGIVMNVVVLPVL